MRFTVNERLKAGNLYRDVTMQYFRYNESWSVYVKCRRRIVSLFVVPLAVVGVVSFHVSLTHGIQYCMR